jgi:hypothetical protein
VSRSVADELVLSADDEHSVGVCAAQIAATCEHLGLRAEADRCWVLAEPTLSLEVRLPDDDPVRSISCRVHVREPRAAGVVVQLAAALGWQAYDPQTHMRWRDPGPAPDGGWPPDTGRPVQRQVSRLDTDGSAEAIHSIVCLPDGRVLVGQDNRSRGSAPWVSERSGPNLTETRRRDLGVPLAVCPEGRRIAGGGGRLPLWIADTDLVVNATWSLGNAVWLPDWPSALLAVTRYHADRNEPPTAPDGDAAAALARWEQIKDRRLLVIDTTTSRAYQVGRYPYYLRFHHKGLLAVAGDGAMAFVGDGSHTDGVSLDSGETLWSYYPPALVTGTVVRWAMAASPCGRFVAVGGSAGGNMPRQVELRNSKTGRLLVGFPASALHHQGVVELAFHPGGWLAAGTSDGTISHITPKGAMTSYRLDRSAINAIAFTPDGSNLLAGGRSGVLYAITLTEAERRMPPGSSPTKISAAERERRIASFDVSEPPPGPMIRSTDYRRLSR